MSHSKTDTIPDGWKAPNGMWVIQSLTDPALQALIAHDGLVLELFAGPGGMSEGLALAGIAKRACLGIEWDSSACMTATAAGHPRLHADLTTIDPLMFGRVWGFHASPSCQGFSFAGKGASRGDVDLLLQAIAAMGREPHRADEIMATLRTLVKSPLSPLSLEPLRYILALRPRWFTLEQVRAVLPLWEAYAEVLRPLGYSVWTGIESSEKFGVPQTRERALAMGSLDIDVSGGLAQTHSRYIKSGKRKGQQEPGFLPYVTMAQALGWGMTQRPYVTVAAGTKSGGTDPHALGGSGARRTVATELEQGRWVGKPLEETPMGAVVLNSDAVPQQRDGNAPAFTVTGGGRNVGFAFLERPTLAEAGTMTDDEVREAGGWGMTDRPAYTFCNSGHGGAGIEWGGKSVREEMIARAETERDWIRKPVAANEGTTEAYNRPSPTIVSSFHPEVVATPKYRKAGDGPRQKALGSIRVTVQEAGILQSFRPDYPWTGNVTKQYEQVGNAVPPLLGQALAETAIGIRPTATSKGARL